MSSPNEIILNNPYEKAEHSKVRVEDDTVWLTQMQMAALFGQSKQNISLHIYNCFNDGEPEKIATVKQSLTVQVRGKRLVQKWFDFSKMEMPVKEIILKLSKIKNYEGENMHG